VVIAKTAGRNVAFKVAKMRTLRVATSLLQGKRNCRVAVKILVLIVRARSRLGDERLKAFYIAGL